MSERTDFIIRKINNVEYKFKLNYYNQKFMIARFGISNTDFAKFDKYLGEILYSCICDSDETEGKRGSFEQFEKILDNETIEYLMEVTEEIIEISFPNKFQEVLDEQSNNDNDDDKKK